MATNTKKKITKIDWHTAIAKVRKQDAAAKKSKKSKNIINVKEEKKLTGIYADNLLKGKIEALNLAFHLNTRGQKEFGQISNKEILASIKEHNLPITKQMLDEKNPKTYGIGKHTLKINISKKVVATLNITIQTKNA